MSKNIVLIRFSFRDHGNCAAIAANIKDFYNNCTVADYVIDNNVVVPCNDCDYECLTPGKTCPNVTDAQKDIMDAICNADMAYYIVQNYCGYPSTNYFAFNERSVGYFNMDRALMQKYKSVTKKFIVVSNTEGENFINALQQQVMDVPQILYLKTSKYGKRSTAGDMMESEDAQADLKAFLTAEIAL